MVVSESSGGNFPQCPTGLIPARCYSLVDIGTQTDNYDGRSNTRRQVVLTFETPLNLIEGGDYDGQPFALSQFYTASLSAKAKLRHDLESWRGREFTAEELAGFDLQAVLGKTCTLNVISKTNKSRIGSILAAQSSVKLPPMVNKMVYFSLDAYDEKAFQSLPEWQRKFIEKSPEYKAIKSGKPKADPMGVSPDDIDDGDSSIPF